MSAGPVPSMAASGRSFGWNPGMLGVLAAIGLVSWAVAALRLSRD